MVLLHLTPPLTFTLRLTTMRVGGNNKSSSHFTPAKRKGGKIKLLVAVNLKKICCFRNEKEEAFCTFKSPGGIIWLLAFFPPNLPPTQRKTSTTFTPFAVDCLFEIFQQQKWEKNQFFQGGKFIHFSFLKIKFNYKTFYIVNFPFLFSTRATSSTVKRREEKKT